VLREKEHLTSTIDRTVCSVVFISEEVLLVYLWIVASQLNPDCSCAHERKDASKATSTITKPDDGWSPVLSDRKMSHC
jgi:hypothetical protein